MLQDDILDDWRYDEDEEAEREKTERDWEPWITTEYDDPLN